MIRIFKTPKPDAELQALNSDEVLARLRGQSISDELIRSWISRVQERKLPPASDITPNGGPTQRLLGCLVKLAAHDRGNRVRTHHDSAAELPERPANELEAELLNALEHWMNLPEHPPSQGGLKETLAATCLRLLHHRCVPLQTQLLTLGAQHSQAGRWLCTLAHRKWDDIPRFGADIRSLNLLAAHDRYRQSPNGGYQSDVRSLQATEMNPHLLSAYSEFWRAQLRPLVTQPITPRNHQPPVLSPPLTLLRLTGPAHVAMITPAPGDVGGNGWHYAMGGGDDWFTNLRAPQMPVGHISGPAQEWAALILGTDPDWPSGAGAPYPSVHLTTEELTFPQTLTDWITENHSNSLIGAVNEIRHLAFELPRVHKVTDLTPAPDPDDQLRRTLHLIRALRRAHAWLALTTQRAEALSETNVLPDLIGALPPALRSEVE